MHFRKSFSTLLSLTVVLVQIIAFPSLSFAQEAASEPTTATVSSEPAPGGETTSSPPASEAQQESAPPAEQTEETQGPTSPTGADSKKYTRNEDGTWTNGIYTWNPATQQTSPNTPQDYSYNPATGQWDTTEWVYYPESGKYVPNVVSSAVNPATGATGNGELQ